MSEHRSGSAAESQARGAPGAERAPRSQTVDPLVGRTINARFRITGVIARGGMGKVYTAVQAPLGRVCAVKVLSPRYDGDHDPEFHRRFFLEASTASKINHPNTVTIFDYGKADDADLYYIAMEYIEGRTLYRALREDGPFPEARAAHIARQICRGVREAHKIGVVHRDLKPGNVLLSDHGDEHDVVKVLDFGLVKVVTGATTGDLTEEGLFLGSPKYMSPEQILGHDVSARTDLYALGVMIYEMLCGKVPFDRGTNMHTLLAHVNEALPPIAGQREGLVISPEMEAIVERCLAKDPVARYASTDELLVALRSIGESSPYSTHEALPRAAPPASVEASTRPGPDPILTPPAADPFAVAATRPSPGAPPPRALAAAPTEAQTWAAPEPPLPASVDPSAVPTTPYERADDAAADTRRAGAAPPGPAAPAPSSGDSLGAAQRTAVDEEAEIAAFRGRSRRGLGPILGAAVAIAIAAAAVVVTTSGARPAGESATQEASAAAPTPTAPPSPTTVTTADPPARAPRVVRVESEPAGAVVTEAGRPICPATPCEARFADAAAAHVISLEKAGWKPQRVSVGPTDDRVSARLQALPATPAAPMKDYKPSPY